MLRKRIMLLFIGFVAVSWTVAGCSQSSDIIPLRVTYDDDWPTSPDTVSIWLENINADCIVFPYDFGAKIYYEKNNEKNELKNLMDYFPHDNITISAKGEILATRSFTFTPDLSGLTVTESTRFVLQISGEMCKSGKPFIQEIPFAIR